MSTVAKEYVERVVKRIVVVVLLGCVGLTAGVVFGTLFPSYDVTRYDVPAGLLLPANSPHSASELVIMTRDDHPGVRVIAYGGRCQGCRWLRRHIGFDATGSLGSTERAVHLAIREVIAVNDGKVDRTWPGEILRLPPRRYGLSGYGLIGLLAGISAALGFLVPPRSRLTAR
jgi:hypothetical protein